MPFQLVCDCGCGQTIETSGAAAFLSLTDHRHGRFERPKIVHLVSPDCLRRYAATLE